MDALESRDLERPGKARHVARQMRLEPVDRKRQRRCYFLGSGKGGLAVDLLHRCINPLEGCQHSAEIARASAWRGRARERQVSRGPPHS